METDRESDALRAAAAAALNASDCFALVRCARDLIEHCEASGDKLGLGWGYYFAGGAHFQRNDGSAAVRAYRKALELFNELDERLAGALVMVAIGAVVLDIDLDVDEARQLYDRAIPVIRGSGDKRRLAVCLGNLGEISRLEGHPAQAIEHATEALALFRHLDEPAQIGWQLTDIAHYHALRRDYAAAVDNLRAAHIELSKQPIARWIAWYFDVWFILAAEFERWEIAASLLGFIDHYRDANEVPRMQAMLPWSSLPVERLAERARAHEHLFDLRIAGEALTLPEAQALTESLSPSSRPAR
jgi:tetratricopeptide (TPR) repeat protein